MYKIPYENEQITKSIALPYAPVAFTEAEKAQARENIGAQESGKYSNPNLLDNPWFAVNQRELTSGFGGEYAADRWSVSYGSGGANWTREDDGCITMTPTNTASYAVLIQNTDPALFSLIVGEICTFSVMMQNGTIYSGTGAISSTDLIEIINIRDIGNGTRLSARISPNGQILVMGFYGSITIKAVKLEKGPISTLANDMSPDYYDELDHCKWYFERIKAQNTYSSFGNGFGETTTSAQMQVPMRPKRTMAYTVSTSGSFILYNGAQSLPISALAKGNSGIGQNVLCLSATATNLTQGSMYALLANNDASAYIDINAELQ